jgi:YgiT-type zinc finger domain-containing protein
MKCVICKHGETAPGEATVTADRGACTVVIKNVPADVCQNCGEYYLSEEATQRVADMADQAERSGTEVEVRRYAA